ncbi:tRNA 2'-phosphotransferase 1 [Oopsacas minuta]|uniref:2'-phosphotransferase n=1 Tax=Oopsacas minuta TaxID=111878 RepID=A0AAV7JCX5_9METZ|nr:tRNA 2'-phosphotransferase 1 [Oopsacas minuta]
MATGGKHKSRYPETEEVKLSKLLSSILRHNFEKEGLKAQPGGYIYLDELMSLPKFKKYSIAQVKAVVALNDKQRFSIRTDPTTELLQIRANQGHSIKVILSYHIRMHSFKIILSYHFKVYGMSQILTGYEITVVLLIYCRVLKFIRKQIEYHII